MIDAVWDWVDANPDPATLMYIHTPAATRQAAALRQGFDDRHVERAFAYINADVPLSTRRLGMATLAVRTLVDVLIAIHPMRLPGGPLSDCSPKALRQAVKELSTRLVMAV